MRSRTYIYVRIRLYSLKHKASILIRDAHCFPYTCVSRSATYRRHRDPHSSPGRFSGCSVVYSLHLIPSSLYSSSSPFFSIPFNVIPRSNHVCGPGSGRIDTYTPPVWTCKIVYMGGMQRNGVESSFVFVAKTMFSPHTPANDNSTYFNEPPPSMHRTHT